MQLIAGLITGLLFGFGLILAGMTNPLKVQNFLDLAGHWDPSLALVMGGAIAVALPGFHLLKRRSRPLLAERFHWPALQHIDGQLVAGAGLFGVGWGLSGLCPGPVFTMLSTAALPTGSLLIAGFFIAMIVGMLFASLVNRFKGSRNSTSTTGQQASVSVNSVSQ